MVLIIGDNSNYGAIIMIIICFCHYHWVIVILNTNRPTYLLQIKDTNRLSN